MTRGILVVVIFLFAVNSCFAGFSAGRIKEGVYEYPNLNGWMTPQKGADICESDPQCAGFTFKGVLVMDVEFELYFFHYVETIYLPKYNVEFWDWTSYTVARDHVMFPQTGYKDIDRYTTKINLGFQLAENPKEAEMLCGQIPYCAGFLQKTGSDAAFILDMVEFDNLIPASNSTIFMSTRSKANQIKDNDLLEQLDKCCTVSKDIEEIDTSALNIVDEIERVDCGMEKEIFVENYVKRRLPVILKNCLNSAWFPDPKLETEFQRFEGLNFDDLLDRMFNRGNHTSTADSRPQLRRNLIEEMKKHNFSLNYDQAEELHMRSMMSEEKCDTSRSFTHARTPNDVDMNFQEMLDRRQSGILRVFLKLSNINSRLDCYMKYREQGKESLKSGFEKCLILDGLWKPTPIQDDFYNLIKYNNDLAWMILSSKNTGSQLHVDPDHMGAWNLLLTGTKLWAVVPFQGNVEDYTCDSSCSHPAWEDGSNAYPWFHHILPQLTNKRLYGKKIVEFVQRPGEVLYLPSKMPHTILNLQDNVALTENYLFNDGLPSLMSSMAMDEIRHRVPDWSEHLAYKILYSRPEVSQADRKKMRSTYSFFTNFIRRIEDVCQ